MKNAETLEARIADLEKRNLRLEALYEIARDLGSSLQLDPLLDRILTRTLEALNSEIGSVLIHDPDEEILWLRASKGLGAGANEPTAMQMGQGISGWVALHREPILVDDVEADPRFSRRNLERYTTNSLISAPLLVRDKLVGVLNVNNKREGGVYRPEDLDLLVAIASQAAVVIDNAHLYEETQAFCYLDSLTRTFNHPSFQLMLEREFERAQRYERPLSLIVIDIDEFKSYNDQYGHTAGEKAIRSISELICKQSRSSDVNCRYGGDEFAVFLPESSAANARNFAEKIRESVDSHYFPGKVGDMGEHLTVSVGIASFPEDAQTHVVLIDKAEAALFEAKFSGKNKISTAEDI